MEATTAEVEYTPKQQNLMEQLRQNLPLVESEKLWKEAGFQIPIVDTFPEAYALSKDGIPSYLYIDGQLIFSVYLCNRAAMDEKIQQRAIESAAPTPPANRLKSVAAMLKTPEIEWLVEDRIHRSGLFQLYAPSYTGKTLVILDLVMSWCAGLSEWQGYTLCNAGEPQQAVYVAAEGGPALSVHIDAWRKHHPEVADEQLSGLVFLDGGDGDAMYMDAEADSGDSWARLAQEIADLDLEPSVLVFDTQIDLAPSIDENSNKDMVGLLRTIKRIGDESNALAIAVHHTGHDESRARGASGMMGKCDAQARLLKKGEGSASIEWTKVKGRAKPAEQAAFKITPVVGSEGAVCAPISNVAAAAAEILSKAPTVDFQRSVMNHLGVSELSARDLAKRLDLSRDTKAFTDGIAWMKHQRLIESNGRTGAKAALRVCAMAVAPTEEP